MNEQKRNFENMMRLAEYAADQHKERRSTIFRIFISYMTLLVVISGVIVRYWGYTALEKGDGLFWGLVGGFLVSVFIIYWRWLIIFYHASDNDVRRRSFYLIKAQVISHYMTNNLSQCYSACEYVDLNLGNRKNKKISEKCLFEQRSPDIDIDGKKDTKCVPSPTVIDNHHFWFHFFAPFGLTSLIIGAFSIKSRCESTDDWYCYWAGIFIFIVVILAIIFGGASTAFKMNTQASPTRHRKTENDTVDD